jgi:predicted permease
MAMHLPVAVTVRQGNSFARWAGLRVSGPFLSMFEIAPVIGRVFRDADDQGEAAPVLVLAYDTWTTRFARNPQVVGTQVAIDGSPFTVIGVMPEGFSPLDRSAAFWVPWSSLPANGNLVRVGVLARVRDDVSLTAAQADADRLCAALLDVPATRDGDPGSHRIEIVRWRDELVAPVRRTLPLLMAAATFVLLIAIVNLGNLFTVRAIRQRHDLAIRVALGAGRARLVRQVLTEHFQLALLGGVAGVVLAWAGTLLVHRLGAGLGRLDLVGGERMLPRVDEIAIDGSVLLYAVALVLVTTIACSVGAMWRLSRLSPGPALAVPDASAPVLGRGAPVLIWAQVTLTVVLMVGALLLIRSFTNLLRVDPGYKASDVLTFQVVPRDTESAVEFATWGRRQVEVADALVARVSQLPGVSAVGFTSNLPMNEGSYMLSIATSKSGPATPIEQGRGVVVSADYFRAMGMPIVAGRAFRAADAALPTGSFIVNQALARRYFGNADPVGKPVYVWGIAGQIVGVVGDIHATTLSAAPQPQLYMIPFRGQPFLPLLSDGLYFTVRAGHATAMVPMIREAARAVAPDAPIQRVAMLDDILANSLRPDQASAWIVGIMASGSLALVAIGLYGLVAYLIAQRTREIAIRLALGARQREVRALVTRDSLLAVLAGVVAGVAVCSVTASALRGLLFGVGESDPGSVVLASGLVVGIALAACGLSARKASAIEPMTLLRTN